MLRRPVHRLHAGLRSVGSDALDTEFYSSLQIDMTAIFLIILEKSFKINVS